MSIIHNRKTIAKITKLLVENDDFISNNTCQHFISWRNMKRYRKNKPNVYNQLLFEFIKKFSQNSNNNYVCKSCNCMLKISKDITESFQIGSTNILAINLSTESSLENLRQYEKYKYSIKNIGLKCNLILKAQLLVILI